MILNRLNEIENCKLRFAMFRWQRSGIHGSKNYYLNQAEQHMAEILELRKLLNYVWWKF